MKNHLDTQEILAKLEKEFKLLELICQEKPNLSSIDTSSLEQLAESLSQQSA